MPAKSNLSRVLLTFFAFILISFSLIKEVSAIDPTPTTATSSASTSAEIKKKQAAMKKGNNQESWMKESASSNLMVGNNALLGDIPDDVIDGKTTSWIPGGLIGGTNKAIAALYNPPMSGVQYIASSVNSFLGKPVMAQGYGFSGLQPLLSIWKTFRNTVYVLFSIFFVVIGLMIMLRIKISPQATITLQNSIPKIISSLILVTFSYAIAGLLIDFSYVIINLGTNLIGSIPNLPPNLTNPLVYSNKIFSDNAWGMTFAPLLTVGGISAIIGGIVVAAAASGGMAAVLGIVAALIILLLFACVVWITLLKFTFALAKCYLTVLFQVILAPFIIAVGAFPNSKSGFSKWFITLLANLAVFPVSFFYIILGYIVWSYIGNSTSPLWAPEIIGDMGNPFWIKIIIGFGVLLLLPKIPNLVIEAVFQLKSPFGAAIGEAVKGVPMRGLATSVVDTGIQKGSVGIWNKITSGIKAKGK